MNADPNVKLQQAIATNQDVIKFEEMLIAAWQFAMDAKIPTALCMTIAEMHNFQMRLETYQRVVNRNRES